MKKLKLFPFILSPLLSLMVCKPSLALPLCEQNGEQLFETVQGSRLVSTEELDVRVPLRARTVTHSETYMEVFSPFQAFRKMCSNVRATQWVSVRKVRVRRNRSFRAIANLVSWEYQGDEINFSTPDSIGIVLESPTDEKYSLIVTAHNPSITTLGIMNTIQSGFR